MINGQGTPPIPQMKVVNPLVDYLQNLIAAAASGHISSMCVITVSPQSQVSVSYAGGQRGDMYVGCGMASKRLLNEIEAPPQRSGILRPSL